MRSDELTQLRCPVDHRGMCNQQAVRKSAAEVASHFRAEQVDMFNVPEEVFPGTPGMIVREDGGTRRLQAMTWGFPRHQVSKRTGLPIKPKAVYNARDDRLGIAFWQSSFAQRRCLIPMTEWAEAEGEVGKMTRTWFSLPDTDLFAVAGVWRRSDEWGDVYSMVTVKSCMQMDGTNDRMPAILQPSDWRRWTHGTFNEAFALLRTFNALVANRTADPWAAPRISKSSMPKLL
jgi:putative SOS response-associated peptidase YedK